MDVMTDWGLQLSLGADELAEHLASTEAFADDQAWWLDGLEERMSTVRVGLQGMGRCVDGGGYDDALSEAPRLRAALSRLCAERSRVEAELDELAALVEHQRAQARLDLDLLARHARVLLLRTRMATHRAMTVARDAYEVDLGGPTG